MNQVFGELTELQVNAESGIVPAPFDSNVELVPGANQRDLEIAPRAAQDRLSRTALRSTASRVRGLGASSLDCLDDGVAYLTHANTQTIEHVNGDAVAHVYECEQKVFWPDGVRAESRTHTRVVEARGLSQSLFQRFLCPARKWDVSRQTRCAASNKRLDLHACAGERHTEPT